MPDLKTHKFRVRHPAPPEPPKTEPAPDSAPPTPNNAGSLPEPDKEPTK